MRSIHEVAREHRRNYKTNEVEIVEGLSFNLYETLRQIEFITNSEFISGADDENGIPKPFQNIVTRLLNNQRTSEDLDRKDIKIKTDNPKYFAQEFLLDKFNQVWMREVNLAATLNKYTETRGKYGGVLVKKTEKDGELFLDVVDWNQIEVDPLDILSGVKIEKKFYTPAQLIKEGKDRGWDEEAIHSAIETYAEANQEDSEISGNRETIGDYIQVREISGILPRQYIDENAKEYEYSQQIHVLAGCEFYEESDAGRRDRGAVLYSSEEKESRYKYHAYRKRTGTENTLGIGIVEEAKQAQQWTNYGALKMRQALDLATLPVLQSSSKKLKGKNVFSGVKAGTVLEHEDGKPMTAVNLTPNGLAALQQFTAQWQEQINQALSASAISTGGDMPSGTPYRLAALIDRNAEAPYALRREEAGIFWNEIYKDWVIPYLVKRLKRTNELIAELEPEELMQIDNDFSVWMADSIIIDNLLAGKYDQINPEMRPTLMEEERNAIVEMKKKELRKMKNRREFTYPEGYWKDITAHIELQVTDEQLLKGAYLETISNVLLQYLQYKDIINQDPTARKLFEKIVNQAGISPVEFSEQQATAPQVPQMQPNQGAPIEAPEIPPGAQTEIA